ncbi:hypothetical protein ACOSQ4_004427 [Xanthoceras sorbifolium]
MNLLDGFLKQNNTVSSRELSQRVDGLPEEYLIGCFIAGLRDDIRLDLKVKKPRSLSEAIGVARLIEEQNQLQRRTSPYNRFQPAVQAPKLPQSSPLGLLGPAPTHKPLTSTRQTAARRVTGQEAKERREKGLCYCCDERYTLGHHCQRPQLFIIED